MKNIDLKDLTQSELLDLNNQIKEALNYYENRNKEKVFKLNVFGQDRYFETAEELKTQLLKDIRDHDFSSLIGTGKGIEANIIFMDKIDFNNAIQ